MQFVHKRRIVLTICAIGLVVGLHYIGWLRPIENLFRRVLIPGSQAVYSIQVQLEDREQIFTSVASLQQAYIDLEKKYKDTVVDEATLRRVEDENTQLREQLTFIQDNQYSSVGADVIGKSTDALRNTLIINQGELAGIDIGDPVIVGNGIYIGKIARVETDTSIVQLLSDHQSKVASTIVNTDHSIGLVEGGYGVSTQMNFIPQNEVVQIDDVIITSGLERNIPRGLTIGSVEAVEKEAYQPFQRAIVTPLAAIDRVSVVSVLTGNSAPNAQ